MMNNDKYMAGALEQGLDPGAADYEPRVIVKFNDDLEIPYHEGAGQFLVDQKDEVWLRLREEQTDLTLQPLFTSVNPERIQELVYEAQARAQEMGREYSPPNFLTYFRLEGGTKVEPQSLADAIQESNNVQFAYVDRPGPDPLFDPTVEPRWNGQRHWLPAPEGVDAQFAWSFIGGTGDAAGLKFVDLERGWTLNHEDLVVHNPTLIFGNIANDSRSHGTSVLGIVCAEANNVGGVGVVPNLASVAVVSFYLDTRPNAMMAAIDKLDAGDVLLVEAQVEISVNGADILAPVDFFQADFDTVHLATQKGIIVVEPGGNGTKNGNLPALNLDLHPIPRGDSGAIIVSAATSAVPHSRLLYAPFGGRIDCYAWGENIDTSRSDPNASTNRYRPQGGLGGFNGTSGAAAIIAGVALAVQSLVKAQVISLHGRELREIFRDPAFGTLPDPLEPTTIGVMPDLKKIISVLH